MRSILIAFLITIIISTLYLSFEEGYFNNQSTQQQTQVTQKEYRLIKYLIPVTGFTGSTNQISKSQLTTIKFVTLAENMDLVPTQYHSQISTVDSLESIKDEIVLLTPEQMQPWYKTVQIENINPFWSKEFNSEDYPFKKEVTVKKESDKTDNYRTVIFAAGEIIPARAVDRLGLNKYDNYTYLFDSFKKDIESADIALALLENAVLGNPSPCTGCMLFVGDDRVIKGIADTGFDFIATSGNHAGDAGQKAYLNTIQLLNQNKVEYSGTGNCISTTCEQMKDPYDVLKPAIKEINGQRIGMLSADDVASYYWKSNETTGNFGTNSFSNTIEGLQVDETKVKRVGEIKKKYDIDYLIIYMSWGIEYTNTASGHQKKLGHKLIDAGADIIIGSHPHWVQNIEFYNEKPIIYSLGNFIFDQTHTLETRQGAAINLYYFNNLLKSIEIMPHQICGYHQTKNDLSPKWIVGEINQDNLENTTESKGCVYWQPKKLRPERSEYLQILNRMYEST
jgi:poly-gamma-glutamate synthesis protein (capsule biosynthesis protein)